MAKVISAKEANPLSLKVRIFYNRNSGFKSLISFGHTTFKMYQGLPSTPPLRQLSFIMPYVDSYILHMNYFSGLIWSLATVESCQKRAGAFFYSLLLLFPVIDWCFHCMSFPFVYTETFNFPLYLSSRLYFYGWLSI